MAFITPRAFERAAQAFDEFGGDRFEDDVAVLFIDLRFRAFFNFKFLAQPARNDHLAFRAEINRLC